MAGKLTEFLEEEFKNRNVSPERLARAEIEARVLYAIPPELARKHNILPVVFLEEESLLSVVTAAPDDDEALREIHLAADVRELRVYVSTKEAIQQEIEARYDKHLT